MYTELEAPAPGMKIRRMEFEVLGLGPEMEAYSLWVPRSTRSEWLGEVCHGLLWLMRMVECELVRSLRCSAKVKLTEKKENAKL